MADVVLPACTSAEKEGTFTDVQGKVNRVRQALEPNEEARPDWEIFAAIGSLLGYPMDYQHSNAIQAEIMKLLPGYYNLGEPRPVVAECSDARLNDIRALTVRPEHVLEIIRSKQIRSRACYRPQH